MTVEVAGPSDRSDRSRLAVCRILDRPSSFSESGERTEDRDPSSLRPRGP
jgi:hypothetical protein